MVFYVCFFFLKWSILYMFFFFFSSRRRHTRSLCDWSSDVCSSDLSVMRKSISKQMFTRKYADVFKGDALWRKIAVKGGLTYKWDDRSTYVQNPPYFDGMHKRSQPIEDIVDARILGLFLD